TKQSTPRGLTKGAGACLRPLRIGCGGVWRNGAKPVGIVSGTSGGNPAESPVSLIRAGCGQPGEIAGFSFAVRFSENSVRCILPHVNSTQIRGADTSDRTFHAAGALTLSIGRWFC